MALLVVNALEIIGIDHQKRAHVIRVLLQLPANLALGFLPVVKACQGVALRPLAQILDHLFFIVDIRDDADGF